MKLTPLIDFSLAPVGRLSLELAGPETFRLRVTTGKDFEPDTSYAVIRDEFTNCKYQLQETKPGYYTLQTPKLIISMQSKPFSLKVTDLNGQVKLHLDNLQVKESAILLSRKLEKEEAVYGLGEHGETFNRVPGRFRFWNTDEDIDHVYKQYYCNIPVGISHQAGKQHTHGFFLDNPGEVFMDIGFTDNQAFRYETMTGDLRLWYFFGENPEAVVKEYTALTGRMQRPPLWSLGFHQCRWSYPTEKRVMEIADEFRKREIPCDVIWLDIDYMDRYRVFTWNQERFPHPEKMITALKKMGYATVCILDPGVAAAPEDYHACREGLQKEGIFLKTSNGKYFIGRCWPGDAYYPDFTNPETRQLWGKWLSESLLSKGIAGIWNDMNEPSVFHLDPRERKMAPDAVHYDFGQYRNHQRIHNIYGFNMAKASSEAQMEHRDNTRHFTLTRSGWAGIQRYTAVWTGDNRSAWTNMPTCLSLNLNMSMSGVSFVGCDIGGFANDASAELFTRWMEWGIFQPFTRAHSTIHTKDHEPWSFGEDKEQLLKKLIELRYQLLPYVYTQFVESAATGAPVNRPMIYQFPGDKTCASIGDQFMFGPEMLICPILDPGKDTRTVYLPEGTWFDFWNGQKYHGAQWMMVQSPLGQPPVFVRAGAVIPMHPVRQHTNLPEPKVTYLDIYPGTKMQGQLVEDDGKTLNYQKGDESVTRFTGKSDKKTITLKIHKPDGRYKSGRKSWTIRVHGMTTQPLSVLVNQKSVKFDYQDNQLVIDIKDTRELMEMVIQL